MSGPSRLSLFPHARRPSPDARSSADSSSLAEKMSSSDNRSSADTMNLIEMLSEDSYRSSKTSQQDNSSKTSQQDGEPQAPIRKPSVPLVKPTKSDTTRNKSHRRSQSLHVTWTEADVTRFAQEVYDETIAEVHLSLFGFWIREKEENYNMAKAYIRELGLDQGYNPTRIPNPTLRRLLQDAHPMRPKSVARRTSPSPSRTSPPNIQNYYRSSSSSHSHSSSSLLLSPRALRLRYSSELSRVQLEAQTNRSVSREPLHAISTKLRMSSITPRRAVSTMGTESAPQAERAERQKDGMRSSSLNFVARGRGFYPPDTPDRPAPLSLRSRPSQTSSATPPTPSMLRSVSSPTRTMFTPSLSPIPLPRNSVLFKDTAAHPLLVLTKSPTSTAVDDPDATADDVFGYSPRPANTFIDMSATYSDDVLNRSVSRRYASREPYTQHSIGPYALNPADESSGESSGVGSGPRAAGKLNRRLLSDVMGLDSYAASDDEQSVLETVSPASNEDGRMPVPVRYTYASSVGCELRESLQAPVLPSFQSDVGVGFCDPEDEDEDDDTTSLYSDSLEEILDLDKFDANEAANEAANTNDSLSATLSAFPIPRMSNPAGALPMTLLRATSGPPPAFPAPPPPRTVRVLDQVRVAGISDADLRSAAHRAIGHLATNPVIAPSTFTHTSTGNDNTLLATAWRTIAEADVTNILLRTRVLGAQLPLVDWESLSRFERTWREVNADLLVAMYGNRDVELTDQDVDYVDCTQRILRGSRYEDWARGVLRG